MAIAEDGIQFHPAATPAEGLSGRFVHIDRKRYGVEGVTDIILHHLPIPYPKRLQENKT